jgi:ribosomal protein S18 acetylase RimI-like enzyme
MRLARRRFDGEADRRRMHALALAFPDQTLHVADLPYRLCASPLRTVPYDDVALWEDEAGNLVGFGVIQYQMMLDVAIDPRARDAGIEPRLLEWAVGRFERIAAGRSQRLPYWLFAREDDADRHALFERFGFAPGDWRVVHLRRRLDGPIEAPRAPAGFTLRPLGGEAEVAAYVECHRAAFGSQVMTVETRRCTLGAPAYRPELDLVAEAPDSRLAAFAIFWLNPTARGQSGERDGQIEPAGTHPDFQRRGLASALLLEGFRRLQAAGAAVAIVETDDFRGPAQRLYASVGLTLHHEVVGYARQF